MRTPDIRCRQYEPAKTSVELHPGWIRATAILLVGIERLRLRKNGEVAKNEGKTRR